MCRDGRFEVRVGGVDMCGSSSLLIRRRLGGIGEERFHCRVVLSWSRLVDVVTNGDLDQMPIGKLGKNVGEGVVVG